MIDAVIFDMDGVLIDSEPLWQKAEIDLFGEIGVPLTPDLCATTMGLRIDEVVAHWRSRFPWEGPSDAEMVDRVVTRMVELIGRQAEPLPGVGPTLELLQTSQVRMALATSSFKPIMRAVLDTFELHRFFEVAYSAEEERWGKPHPGIYLTVAERMSVLPTRCLAVEDSVNGVLAAKAARMKCVAIPDLAKGDPRFAIADGILDSLYALPGWLEDEVPVDEQDSQKA